MHAALSNQPVLMLYCFHSRFFIIWMTPTLIDSSIGITLRTQPDWSGLNLSWNQTGFSNRDVRHSSFDDDEFRIVSLTKNIIHSLSIMIILHPGTWKCQL